MKDIITGLSVVLLAASLGLYYRLQSEHNKLKEFCKNLQSEGPKTNSSNRKTPEQEFHNASSDGLYTSIVCHDLGTPNFLCEFQNLCYWPSEREFIVFTSNISVFDRFDADVAGEINLSSINKHTAHKFTYMEIPYEASKHFNISTIHHTSVIFRRNKPDNIMHVFHDDIIPLYHTLKIIHFGENCEMPPFATQILYADVWGDDEFDYIYKLLSNRDPIHINKFSNENLDLLCFKHSYVGLIKSTLWYQYGFFKPQGPIVNMDNNLGKFVREASNDLQILLQNNNERIVPQLVPENYIVLISRKTNRKMMNEVNLMIHLSQVSGLKVVSVSFETHSFEDMIPLVHNSLGIIGMHGSLMMLSVFLKSNNFVIELFPFAVNPDDITPFRTLSDIPGVDLRYMSWVNKNKANTLSYPDNAKEFGGIRHLPTSHQEEIVAQTLVPPHLCCEDPSWLFHIYQDTIVDVIQVGQLLAECMSPQKQRKHSKDNHPLPGQVKNVRCVKKQSSDSYSLDVRWDLPSNVRFLAYKELLFHILVQEDNSEESKMYVVSSSSHSITGIATNIEYSVWVRAVADGRTGPFSSIAECV